MIPAENRQIPVRVYTPFHTARDVKLPILIFIHGGGWTLGSITTYDSIARGLANKIPAIVVSVEYRLAPENPFPAGLEDALAAAQWVIENAGNLGGDPARIGIAGDSGGGNLATVVIRRALKRDIRFAFQALFYPSIDIASMNYPSYDQYGDGYLLTKKCNSEVSPILSARPLRLDASGRITPPRARLRAEPPSPYPRGCRWLRSFAR